MLLSIAETFSRYPAGRYRSDGPFSGERFREELLVPALLEADSAGSELVVQLDGTTTYSSSFLEESFGGLVRSKRVPLHTIQKRLKIRADDIAFRPAQLDAQSYILDEIKRQRK